MSEVIVYSYGVAEFTSYVFNAVAATVNNKSFDSVLKVTFLISGLIAAVQYSMTRQWSTMASSLIRYIAITTLLLIPKYTVTIHDDVAQSNYGVANVPLGLALPASYVTTAFHALTTMMETTFHWPDEASYSKTGFLFASQIVKNTSSVQIVDPDFKKSLNSFIAQCVFYDIYLGAYTLKDLLNSNDIWGLVTRKASLNRAFMLDDTVTVCRDGIQTLNTKWADALASTTEKYMKIIMPHYSQSTSDDVNIQTKTLFLSQISSGYNYLTGLSKDVTNILQQNLMVNTLQNAALNNPELGVQSYSITKANVQKASGNTTMGYMMARWLPAMMGVVECMIYALFPLIIMFALFTNGEKVIGNYVMAMCWVGSWPIIYSILNFGFTWIIRTKSSGYGLSYYDLNYLNDLQYNMSSLFGYFTITVPFLAGGLLKLGKQGLDSTFTHMSQLVGGSTQSLAMAASGEAVAGNFSMGNTSFDNHSMHNTNGFKHDMNTNYASGAMGMQLASGSMLTQTADGTNVVKMGGAMSDLNTNVNFSEQISTAASIQSDKALSAAKNDQRSFSENSTSALRNLYDIGHQINTGTSTGDSFSENTSGGFAEAASQYSVAIDKFSHENNISKQDAGRFLVGAYANASGAVNFNTDKQLIGKIVSLASGSSGQASISGGIKSDGELSWTKQDAENYSKAQEFLKNNNLTSTFDKAIKGVEEHSYRAETRDGQHLTEGLSASYDKAIQAGNSYSTHMQESVGYREVANYSKNQSASVNYNGSQELMEYIASQPLYLGQGAMGSNDAEALLRTNPELRQDHTEKFVQQKTEATLEKWKAGHINSNDTVNAGSGFMHDTQIRQNNVENNYEFNKSAISKTDAGLNINKVNIDDSVKNKVQSTMTNAEKEISATSNSIKQSGDKAEGLSAINVKSKLDTSNQLGKVNALIEKNAKLKESID